ncbi:MAG: DUF4249 domain-containing protein [Candidatus Latescibacteria bacterium]|nr:DUF4249 domain-containing protein [Candidatus Latescibacterota bacterium]
MVLTRARIFATVIALWALSCSPEREGSELFAPGGLGIPVVDAVLVVGQPFSDIYLSQTIAPDELFTREGAGLNGASVTVEGDANIISYQSMGVRGWYTTSAPFTVQPSTTYRFTATLADGRVVRASTTTPAQLSVREWVLLDESGTILLQTLSTFAEHGDTVYYRDENQLVYPENILAAILDDQSTAGYQIGLVNLETDSPLLIDADFLEEDDLDNFKRTNSSPPLNYEATLRVPWLAIYYAGRYNLRVVALDRNWYDIARTDPAVGGGGFGFGGEAGDTSKRPIFHVDGGIGVFGSVSSDSVGFYVNPPAN